jgi:Fe-S oxidoreductase
LTNQEPSEETGQSLREMAAQCTSCGDCVRPCTFLRRHGTPAAIAEHGLSEDNLRKAFECSLCGLCDALCPEALSPSAMFLDMRKCAVANGLFDPKPYRPWLNYEKLGGTPLFRRLSLPRGCTTVFFPGCSLPGRRPQGVVGLLKKLREQEPTAGLMLDCCGKISHDLGLEDNFSDIFTRLSSSLQHHGVRRILTACPGCSKILCKHGENFEVESIYEVLAQNHSHAPDPGNAGVVAIHDPCPARFDATQQQAVRALTRQAGFQVEELPESGRTTRCCGQGGMVEGSLSGTIAQEAGLIAEQANSRRLVTSCGSCAETLGRHVPTAHVSDLLSGQDAFTNQPISSAARWLNRLRLRFASLS